MTDGRDHKGRFRKGVSGNRWGRPKGAKNRRTVLEEACAEMIYITENGKRKQVSKWEAFIKKLLNKALSDDLRAGDLLLKHVGRYGGWMMNSSALEGSATNTTSAIPEAPDPLTEEEAARRYKDALKKATPDE